jgi:DNA-binding MarR family transcriptional regulator
LDPVNDFHDGEGAVNKGPDRLPLWSRPGYLVRRLHQIHSALFAEECKSFGITPVQYGLLTALHHHPGSDQVTLGAELGIDRSNVADVLARLAERGLARRAKGAADRRTMLAYLTPAGTALMRTMHGAMQRSQERLLAPLPPEQRTAFLAMLVALVDGNSEHGPEAKPSQPAAHLEPKERQHHAGGDEDELSRANLSRQGACDDR